MKKKTMKNKLSFKLFYNDKFVMFFSILAAFIIWMFVSSNTTEASLFTVTDIPVTLPELTDNMKYFGTDGLTASVRISGNALVVTSVTQDDILITAADVSGITKPGTYNLDLIAKKMGIKTDYSFESSVSPSSINVFVDSFDEKTLSITPNITVGSVASSSHASMPKLSQQAIKISGARSVLDTIVRAEAYYVFESTLSETTVVKAPIRLYDDNDKEVKSSYITCDISEVDVTVPILSVKELKIKPVLTNVPDYLENADSLYTADPSRIKIGVPANADLSEILTGPIDFSKVTPDNSVFEAELEIPSGCKNIEGNNTVTVTFDMTDMVSRKVKVSDFTIRNQGSGQDAAVSTKSIEVTVIGPKNYANKINTNNITAIVDIGERSTLTEGIVEVPVTFEIGNAFRNCWIQGSYTVNVSFSPKSSSSNASSE